MTECHNSNWNFPIWGMWVWTGVEPYNYAPYMGLSTQYYRTNPPSFPYLPKVGEVGHTIDRCINDMSFLSDSSEATIILCRVKPSQLSLGEGFSSMPLLLSQGPLKLTDPALKWLGVSFDCLISPSLLNEKDLLLLAGHYANTGTIMPFFKK